MSASEFITTLRSTDHDFVAGLRFLDEYAKHLASRTSHSSNDLGHSFVPRFDLEEHEQSYELYADLPGFDTDHITVEANDDRNIQIGGWIPKRHATAATTAPSSSSIIADPTVAVHHRDLPRDEPRPSTDRFGEVLNPHHEARSEAPAASHRPAAPAPNSSSSPPGGEAPSETARFGDSLDPHASYVHEPKVRYLVAERRFGQFHRAFHFPSPVRKADVTARLENGVLHITAPRAKAEPPVKVEIKRMGAPATK